MFNYCIKVNVKGYTVYINYREILINLLIKLRHIFYINQINYSQLIKEARHFFDYVVKLCALE